MSEADFSEFCLLWQQMADRYGKTLSKSTLALDFAAVRHLTLDHVRQGLTAHLQHPTDCKFFPMPGQIIEHVRVRLADDGRPDAEEAWALALRGSREEDSVVWTPEVAEAWAVARVVFDQGDQVGARVAFKEVYTHVTRAARAKLRPAQWVLSEGFDPQGRADSMRQAMALGRRVEGREHLLMLQGPRASVALLQGPPCAMPDGLPPEGRQAIELCRSILSALAVVTDDPRAIRGPELRASGARVAVDEAGIPPAESIDLDARIEPSHGGTP